MDLGRTTLPDILLAIASKEDLIFKLGQNFCQNFCNPITREHPKLGQNFCQNSCNLKAQMEHSKLGQNFCQNFCNLKAQMEHSKLGQFLKDKRGGFTKVAYHFNIPSGIIFPSGAFFPSGIFPTSGVPKITSCSMNSPVEL